ncbi:UNVERIFIED_CONTAM: hypothetical protein FKN15_006591 [Acipenser sinensis]
MPPEPQPVVSNHIVNGQSNSAKTEVHSHMRKKSSPERDKEKPSNIRGRKDSLERSTAKQQKSDKHEGQPRGSSETELHKQHGVPAPQTSGQDSPRQFNNVAANHNSNATSSTRKDFAPRWNKPSEMKLVEGAAKAAADGRSRAVNYNIPRSSSPDEAQMLLVRPKTRGLIVDETKRGSNASQYDNVSGAEHDFENRVDGLLERSTSRSPRNEPVFVNPSLKSGSPTKMLNNVSVGGQQRSHMHTVQFDRPDQRFHGKPPPSYSISPGYHGNSPTRAQYNYSFDVRPDDRQYGTTMPTPVDLSPEKTHMNSYPVNSRQFSSSSQTSRIIVTPADRNAQYDSVNSSNYLRQPTKLVGVPVYPQVDYMQENRKQLDQVSAYRQEHRGRQWSQEVDAGYMGNMPRNIILNNPKKRNALSLSMLNSLQTDILHEIEREDLRVIIISGMLRNIILNNPKKRNALSLSMLNSLQTDILHEIEREDLRVIIISGMLRYNFCTQVMTLIQDIPVPVIAKVNGMATAAGCQLVASCDIAVASEKSVFATPGVNIGLFCSTPAVAIGRAVPRKVALEMLFTGAPISAQDALLHGLVSKVVLEEKLEEETLKIAQKICDTSRPVVSLGKAMFYRQMAQGRNTAYRMASQAMVDNLALKDGQEGIKSFIEKRQPVWTHTTDKAHK